MPDPKEQLVDAYSNQGLDLLEPGNPYHGVDNWQNTTLNKGDKVAQIEWRDPADAQKPYSRYFTNAEELENLTGPDGKVDMAALSERLQVKAYGSEYNASVSIYEVSGDIPATTAQVSDNPAYGRGGANQYHLREDVLSGRNLEKIDQIEGINRATRLPIYDKLRGLDQDDDARRITDIIDKHNDEFIDALEKVNTPETNRVADDMIERQAFSKTAREIKGDPEAVRAIDIPDATATALDLDSKTLSQVERIRDEALGHGPDRGADGPDKSGSPENNPTTPDEGAPNRGAPDVAPAALDDAALADSKARITAADELGELRGFAATPDGSTSHLIDTKTSTIYTLTGDDLTSVQKFDNSKDAGHAFGRLMSEAADAHPSSFKGLPRVHNSLGALTSHIDDLGRPAWRKALGAFGEGAAEFGGKASKILGPLGVVAAGAEVYGLEMKLKDYEEFGLVSDDAMLAYRGILTAHAAQATVDPSLVGGEVAVQVAHDEWAKAYGIDDKTKEALEPGSLLEDVGDAAKWLEDQAEAAGMAVKDYAVSRWNDPGKLGEDWDNIKEAAEDAAIATGNAIGYAAEAVGDYTVYRYNNPEKLLDDAQAVGETISDGAKVVGGAVVDGAQVVWRSCR